MFKCLFSDTDMTFSLIYIHYIGLNHIIYSNTQYLLKNYYMTLFVLTLYFSQPQYSDNAQSNSGRFIFITQIQ